MNLMQRRIAPHHRDTAPNRFYGTPRVRHCSASSRRRRGHRACRKPFLRGLVKSPLRLLGSEVQEQQLERCSDAVALGVAERFEEGSVGVKHGM